MCRRTSWPPNPRYWQLTPGAAWHGYRHVTPGYAMTDPNKLTLLTPGFDRLTGGYSEHGIPAPVLAQYLRENRIVAEKNDLNSILFLLTPGVESSKAGTLLSALVFFKRLHDDNAPLEEVIPEFVRARPHRYGGMRLRDLCRQMHAFYRDKDTSGLQRKQFRPQHFPTLAMRPQEAVRRLVKNDVDYLPLEELSGRIATTLVGGLSARHRNDRAGRAAGRAGAADDRVSESVRAGVEPVPGLRDGDPGVVPREAAGRIDPDFYLCNEVAAGLTIGCQIRRVIPPDQPGPRRKHNAVVNLR